MVKEFEIKDILNAVNSISKMGRDKDKAMEAEIDSTDKNDVLSLNNQVKSTKSDVLVLDRMID